MVGVAVEKPVECKAETGEALTEAETGEALTGELRVGMVTGKVEGFGVLDANPFSNVFPLFETRLDAGLGVLDGSSCVQSTGISLPAFGGAVCDVLCEIAFPVLVYGAVCGALGGVFPRILPESSETPEAFLGWLRGSRGCVRAFLVLNVRFLKENSVFKELLTPVLNNDG